MNALGRWLVPIALALVSYLLCVRAQAAEVAAIGGQFAQREVNVSPPPDLRHYVGKPVTEILLIVDGGTPEVIRFPWAPPGQRFDAGLARDAIRVLLSSGKYAEVRAEVELGELGLQLRLLATANFVIEKLDVRGGVLPEEDTLNATGVALNTAITRAEVARIAARVWQLYQRRGYPNARVSGHIRHFQDERRAKLVLNIRPGRVSTVASRRITYQAEPGAPLPAQLGYDVKEGDAADLDLLDEADREYEKELRQRGWLRAEVHHELVPRAGGVRLRVIAKLGPLVRTRFEGNHSFDESELHQALASDVEAVAEPSGVLKVLTAFYQERGFLDVGMGIELLHGRGVEDQFVRIREGSRVSVIARTYPCISGPRSAAEVDQELDAFLAEQLPGGDELLDGVDSAVIDPRVGSRGGSRSEPFQLRPTETYFSEAYRKATQHLRDLYRSEGYLSAQVGPARILRRRCDPLTQPNHCVPLGEPPTSDVDCSLAQESPDTTAPEASCVEDPSKGIRCEAKVVLSIPIRTGPQTVLWDVQYKGNARILESELAAVAELELGAPVSQLQLQQARRRILDKYGDEGFPFAAAEVELELSQDRTRGKAVFVIGERERVRVRGFVVRGADRTSHGLIQSRLELVTGDLYRQSKVRESEQQLATLGVFSSVAIGLEDPDVPAREKLVVIRVRELPAQYVDVKPGISTGEGYRARFEYGHRNLGGRAVQARMSVQLGYLPDYFIVDGQVRQRFSKLSLSNRIERRNTLTFEFPIAKRYRLAIDGIDVRDNSRDFGITKRATLATLSYRPTQQISLLTGTSFELNDARIFSQTQTLKAYLEENPQLVRLLNVPEGRSFAIALRAGGTWSNTDNPLGATRGGLISTEVEPVFAFLDDDSAAVDLDRCQEAGLDPQTCEFKSRFVKVSQRIAGYVPFDDRGLSLALSLRWGANFQITDNSSTYPDRLFFFGGGDSLRGFLQASVIPQDIADRLVPESDDDGTGEASLTPDEVVIRGGDFVLNPRIELRIPLTRVFHTAVFLDTGNVWRDINNVNPFVLRYTAGTGVRAITPIGPLAFDYGIKLDRRFYETSLGAFHFSVGLF